MSASIAVGQLRRGVGRAPRWPPPAPRGRRPSRVRVFGSPATITSSDAPTADASAAADPPPGVGSDELKASAVSDGLISQRHMCPETEVRGNGSHRETKERRVRGAASRACRIALPLLGLRCSVSPCDPVASLSSVTDHEPSAFHDGSNRVRADADQVDRRAVRRRRRPSACRARGCRRDPGGSSEQAALIVAATSASSNVRSMPKQASVIANGIDGEKPPPGLTSVASATATPPVDQHPRRREASELQVERRDRQQRRDDAGCRQAGGAGLVDEDQMIRGPRADLRGDRGSAAGGRARRRGCAASARPRGRLPGSRAIRPA